jgi:hypothetical protein
MTEASVSFAGNLTEQPEVRYITVLLAVGLLAAVPLPSAVAQTSTGCPAGWQFRSVESLAATGNAPVPGQIDAAGNAHGFVCALPLPDAVCTAMGFDPCPVETVYVFLDNDVSGR